ncbi:MAG: hypothetical protein Q8P66_01045 [Candidatus Colwellbacteria bacterium]|nr:hypothetical protein [Candidatus Colwellbacteria bacterium]
MRRKDIRSKRNIKSDFSIDGSSGLGAENAVAPEAGAGNAGAFLVTLDGFLREGAEISGD